MFCLGTGQSPFLTVYVFTSTWAAPGGMGVTMENMNDKIVSCVLFLMSAGLFILSFRSFQERGFLFNNAYLYASKQERERMDKKPHYRQSAIVFLLLGFSFIFYGTALLSGIGRLGSVAGMTVAVTIVYAIVSGIRIGKQQP